MKILNKIFVLLAIASLVLAFNPGRSYADFTTSPICTITADNLNPIASSSVTENFTITFNPNVTSNNLTWFFGLNEQSLLGEPTSEVLNSTDFPGGLTTYGNGNDAFSSNTMVPLTTLAGNTYQISATYNANSAPNGSIWLPQFTALNDPNPAGTDGCYMGNTPITPITFHALNAGSVSVTPSPAQVNTQVTASGSFTDPNTSNTHTAVWDWGDGSTPSSGTVTESNGSGTVSGTHTYTTAGVYTVTLTVTSSSGGSATSTYQYLSVYDPTPQGLFSAGHQFTSPTGAYPQNSSLTGNVTFGLTYKYQGTVATGDRQFMMNFAAANLKFNATTVSALVISNGMATLTGTGTINGSGSYNFLVTGVDGGGIRIQITDPSNNNNVIYDTQPGASITTTPTTSVNGRVIVNG